MAVRMIKKSWWVDFRFNHTRYRKRSPENSRAGALAFEAMLRQKLAHGQSITALATQRQTFDQFARRWLEEYVAVNNRYSEQRMKQYVVRGALVPFFGKLEVGQITAYHIERYKAKRLKDGLTNKTIKNHLMVLHKCLVTAYDWLEIRTGFPKFEWPKCSSMRTDYLSTGECERLQRHADGVTREMIVMALRTGMRQGELKGLQWPSIDWENMIVTVRHSRCDQARDLVAPKNNRIRHIPLDGELYNLLYSRRKESGYVFSDASDRPFNHNRMISALDKACRLAGVRRITWHVLRHTFASHLAMKGVPIPIVQTLLGHSTITMTMRYAHVAPSALRTAIELLNQKQQVESNLGQPVGNLANLGAKSALVSKLTAPKNEWLAR